MFSVTSCSASRNASRLVLVLHHTIVIGNGYNDDCTEDDNNIEGIRVVINVGLLIYTFNNFVLCGTKCYGNDQVKEGGM
jgi:hypothetical protein